MLSTHFVKTTRALPVHRQRVSRCTYSTKPPTSELPQPRLDYRSISENVTSKSLNALNRKAAIPNDAVSSVARAYSELKRISSELNSKRNARSAVGERVRRSSDSAEKEAALNEAANLKKEVKDLEAALETVEQECLLSALSLPNDTHPSVPLGPESAATVLSTHGPPVLPSNPKRDHVTVCDHFGLLDLKSASVVSGTSWYYLRHEAALLELALTNYAMSIAVQHGFTPMMTPDVVRSDIAVRCGFQPRDDSNPPVSHMYHISPTNPSSPELVLAGTSEIPLAGTFANKVYSSLSLPLKIVGLGHAFRSEAGARSADTRGLYRVHQFTKVELFSVTTDDASENMMEEMLSIQKQILQGLNLSFKVLDMPTEELGASAYRKYDIEAWMPGRGSWGEVSSLSNCTDYQSRRLHIRYRPQGGVTDTPLPRLPFAHTLNGTAAAIPRLIVALIENGVQFNDKEEITGIRLPHALRPFWIKSGVRDIIRWDDTD
ncbi:Serine--tRNA ligase, chloroplastic/mitochondrial [Psilocybe cubensis]|uniref:Serine--tRNA ligase, chloroplastic/mitochondrial n=2 Tax=Psilocybe cubensis TaxID=181762 RepID=A0ACB8HFP8_PSICU|nr:Serine--tRNA ligase, chloroplastic/mitochondrial [Psilocybe cubensis]KAH9486542.1 Serine--tRNA ligase, chloroplastic/mitochondrial [Psilocybe cubensis]